MAKRSIRRQFLYQLIFASASLIIIFSSVLYYMIQESIYEEKREKLLQVAHNINQFQSVETTQQTDSILGISIELIYMSNVQNDTVFINKIQENGKTYLRLVHPFYTGHNTFLVITKDITTSENLLAHIFKSILIINAIGFLMVILYAVALSKMLIQPINTLTRRLSNMNEQLIKPIQVDELPEEFIPLGNTINHLIRRIQSFIKYQKELFIGAAHELKTPLAVIKLKNQVTLIKKRSAEEYIEAIKTTNDAVNEMDKIVGDILNIGRQEGAQLDAPEEIDVISVIKSKTEDFKLLAQNEGKTLLSDFEPNLYMATLQVKLLNQIIQNFLQNALKFTPKGKTVLIRSRQNDKGLFIEVIDEGCGIDDSIDLFAPFKRQGNRSGVGLGLFLAKSAAEAIGGEVNLKNRTDGIDGTIASLQLQSKLCCPLKRK